MSLSLLSSFFLVSPRRSAEAQRALQTAAKLGKPGARPGEEEERGEKEREK